MAASGRIARALALAALTAAAWIWLLPMHMAPMGSFPDGPPADPMPWSGGTAMFLFIMRSVMMAGMMIPSAVPMVLVHDRVARGNADAVHFHCCVIDGVFAGCEDGQVHFAEAAARTPVDLAAVQQQVRARVLRWFARAGPLDPADARDMAGWHHGGGFSLDASVRIEGADRTGAGTAAALLRTTAPAVHPTPSN